MAHVKGLLRTSFGQRVTSKFRAQPDPVPADSLFASFQSLGDNCEFGLVQGFYGADQLGLLKYGHMSFANLLKALDDRFAVFFDPSLAIRLDLAGPAGGVQEYFGTVEAYGLLYHTGSRPPAAKEEIVMSQRRRLALLARIFMEDLAEAEKIFVYRTGEPVTQGDIEALHARLAAFGPVTLLWVTGPTPGTRPETVTWIGERLLHGTVTRLAPYDDANEYDGGSWYRLCSNVLALRGARQAAAAKPARRVAF